MFCPFPVKCRFKIIAWIFSSFHAKRVEIAFLFPWAMVLNRAFEHPDIGLWALAKGFMFVTILFLGLVAVWVKGDLDWVLTWNKEAYVPTGKREGSSIPALTTLEPDDDGSDDENADADADEDAA